MPSDDQLIAEVLRGSRERFALLVERYQRPIYGYLRRMGLEHDTAADVMQETFIRAYRKLDTVRGEGKFRGWLYTIAGNQARNELRRIGRRRELPLDEVEPLDSEQESPGRAVERSQARERLEQALARLPLAQRRVVVLRALEDLSFKEVAEACQISLSSAKVSYHRALKKMSRFLKSELVQDKAVPGGADEMPAR